jgi:hypothetical protein
MALRAAQRYFGDKDRRAERRRRRRSRSHAIRRRPKYLIALRAGLAQLVEHLICNPRRRAERNPSRYATTMAARAGQDG